MSAFRLTSYQQSYADNRINGMNQADALRNSLYKTDGYSEAALRVQAHKMENHPNIALTIDAGLAKVSEKVLTLTAFTKDEAFRWAQEDREMARKLGQTGAANAANRLACDILGHIVEKKVVNLTADPISDMLESIQGRSRTLPETKH